MIIHGDCLEELKKLPDNSIDSVVTDPPYGLSKEPNITEVLTKWMSGEDYEHRSSGFMGKSWDSFVPGPAIWKEVYRVLKPGGHILCFAGTRTQDLMTISLRLAGFEIRDVIEWLYFSGFPKSLDIGKSFDRRKGGYLILEEFKDYLNTKRKEKGLNLRQINEYLGGAINGGGIAGSVMGDKDTTTFPAKHQYLKLKILLSLDDRYDELIEAAEREKIGEYAGDPGGFGEYRFKTISNDITAPATELAKQYDGWGTQTKPSHEPIILCRKPLEKTVAYNVEKFGVGGLNIEACRIATEGKDKEKHLQEWNRKQSVNAKGNTSGGHGLNSIELTNYAKEGRFPANCITLDDDQFYSKYFNITPQELSKKASKKDRNTAWDGEEITLESMQPVRFASENGSGKMLPSKKSNLESHKVKGNFHPTCKPTSLMAWLIRLITPPNGTVLDPFAGSGTTLVAAKREGFEFIGIEKEAEYIDIINARIS